LSLQFDDGKAFATNQALAHATPKHRLKDMAERITLAEPAVAILREGRVVRDAILLISEQI